ncbi:hypothetical protein L1987_30810 [Smallanthus sonchifolius]|uniref:Uncharacterized protein n=1 Tax=Smallanthus sonchifolius TaxID=185202 RepID=A0ACB9I3U8_9ASTR|nr:hypothetical protein L1987_30810 [Smallanthus sonchifolius]
MESDQPSTSSRAVDTSLDDEQWGLVTWAQDSIKEGNLKRIIDSDIRDEISSKCLRQFVRIVEICLHDSPKQRPTMTEVVSCLQSILALQEKFNNSLQSAGRTIIDRIMLHFTSNRENSAISVKDRVDNNMFPEMKEVPADSQSPNPSAKEFKFDDLKKATGNFSPDLLLGTGGFGNVFLGWIDRNTLAPSKHGDGIAVAVKRFNLKSCQVAEMNLLRRLDHPNIIRLLGCCSHKQEHLIVYEYMLNKSIYDFLFIAEYIRTGHLSTKSNIYSFGVVLLENVTCQRAFDYNRPEGQQSLVEWATQIQSDRRNVNEIMDRRLEHNHPLQGASECFALALRCVERRPKDRPSSEEVLQILKQIYALHK